MKVSRFFSLTMAAIWLLTNVASAQNQPPKQPVSDACTNAEAERTALDKPELRALLKRNPETEAGALPQVTLQQLRRLIELDEVIMFQCRLEAHPAIAAARQAKAAKAQIAKNAKGSKLPRRKNIPPLPVRRPKSPQQGSTPSGAVFLPAPSR